MRYCVNGKRQHAGRSDNWKSKQAKAAVKENVKKGADHTYGAQQTIEVRLSTRVLERTCIHLRICTRIH